MKPEQPKYLLIKNSILARIQEGELTVGTQIPSINEIMEQFGVSKVTAVRAMAELEMEGAVRREHGRGTFVTGMSKTTPFPRGPKRVALLVPDMSNPFNVEVVRSLEKSLREAGLVVELSCSDYQPETERELFSALISNQHLAGIVLISAGVDQMGIDPASIRTPLVVIDSCPEDLLEKCVFINCDHYKGGYDAAVHLASHGHREIGYVDWYAATKTRLEGFRRGLQDFRVDLPERRIISVGPGKPIGADLMDFVGREKLTALFAVNDMLAMQAMQLLRAGGYRIPQDISLMGYDDVMAARYLEVPLTTVEQHEEQIGRKAAEFLLERLDGRPGSLRPREVLIMPRVVERDSTGAPRAAASLDAAAS